MLAFDENGNFDGSLRAVSELPVADVPFSNGCIIGDGTTVINCSYGGVGHIPHNIVHIITRGWDTRREEENGRRVHYLRRREQTPAEGYYSCDLEVDINSPRGVYILYPSEWASLMIIVRDIESHSSPPVTAVTAAIEVVKGTSTFRVRCNSTGGRALDMDVSGPNGYSSDISSNIEPAGTRMYLGSDSYTATTEVISNGMAGDVYQCNVTSVASRAASATLRGKSLFVSFITWISPLLQLLLQPSVHWSKQLLLQSW